MSFQKEDTITALATPSGTGAISVIRLSGPDSFKFIDKIFEGKKKISDSASHTIHYGKIVDLSGLVIDDVLVSVFKNPASYTGEDSVEISSHGSQFIIQKIIKALLETGVRLAEPGEFTKRAFLNGKIDLAQAEAVADIINSRTEASLKGARNQLDGLLSQKIDSIRKSLVDSSSLIELELDFAEEDLEFMPSNKILAQTSSIISEITNLLETYKFGKVVRDGINVSLVGQTNVGKSSLLNYILKEARAIVSPIPGTTRDVIREEATIDGILYRFHDTAGIRFSDDQIEIEGVTRSRKSVAEADLVLFIYDILDGLDLELFNEIKTLANEKKIIKVANKLDLLENDLSTEVIQISAKTGQGINSLFKILKEKTFGAEIYTENTAIVSNIRHFNALKDARDYLLKAEDSIKTGMTGEYSSVYLRSAIDSLGEIIGAVTSEDILNNIFSEFCIGK